MHWLQTTARAVMNGLRDLNEDEQGADALEKLLIVAAIVLPLLGVLFVLRNSIAEWVQDLWESMKGRGENDIEQSVN